MEDNGSQPPAAGGAVDQADLRSKFSAQESEIQRLSAQLSRFLDGQMSAPKTSEPARHALHAGTLQAPSRCDREDDLLSIFAESISQSSPPSHPPSYDPEAELDSLVQAAQPVGGSANAGDQLIELEADDLYEGLEEFGPAVSEGLATRLTKAVTLPPRKESVEKISKQYMTPSNARSVCAPRIEEQLWATIPPKNRSADSRAQKLQKMVVQGMLPYAEIIRELQTAAREQRPINSALVARLAVDGVTLCGNASYEMSMRRREELKPAFNQKYRGICSRSIPVGETLFGKDLQTTLKNVGESYLVGQKVNSSDRPRRRSFGSRRMEPYRHNFQQRDRPWDRSADRHGFSRRASRPTATAPTPRAPPPKFRAPSTAQYHQESPKN
ncbi:uncharacterized protein [Diadema antillarum]|uniref:uncharacterized protein n=1 Tax=Diadema antillarum TaxID=105358 RepID=UPI003A8406FA